jgi:hypothetical protein
MGATISACWAALPTSAELYPPTPAVYTSILNIFQYFPLVRTPIPPKMVQRANTIVLGDCIPMASFLASSGQDVQQFNSQYPRAYSLVRHGDHRAYKPDLQSDAPITLLTLDW